MNEKFENLRQNLNLLHLKMWLS